MKLIAFRNLGWGIILLTLIAWVVLCLYWTQIEAYNRALPPNLVGIASVLIAVGLTFITIYYSAGEWYEVYSRFQKLGIRDADPSRRGRSTDQNARWMKELREARRSVTLAGVTLGGWFITAWDDLRVELPHLLKRVDSFNIILQYPGSSGAHLRDTDEGFGESQDTDASKRIETVLDHIGYLLQDGSLQQFWQQGRLTVYLHKRTPMAVVWIDDVMYAITYLPCVADKECPQIRLAASGTYSEQIKEAINRIRNSSDTTVVRTIDDLNKVRAAMRSTAGDAHA
jgi:hypothetical protein